MMSELKTKDSVAGLVALIAELEAAEVGSRELDVAILRAVNPKQHACYLESAEMMIEEVISKGMASRADAARRSAFYSTPQYTTSIDAALTLVPEGCDWFIAGSISGAMTEHPHKPFYGAILEKPTSSKPVGDGKSRASAPISLCIAALRSRQSLSGERVS